MTTRPERIGLTLGYTKHDFGVHAPSILKSIDVSHMCCCDTSGQLFVIDFGLIAGEKHVSIVCIDAESSIGSAVLIPVSVITRTNNKNPGFKTFCDIARSMAIAPYDLILLVQQQSLTLT